MNEDQDKVFSPALTWGILVLLVAVILAYLFFVRNREGETPFAEPLAGTTVVDIGSGCELFPAAPTVAEGDMLLIRNQDIEPHTLMFAQQVITLEPGAEESIEARFVSGTGAYGYTCDHFPNVRGAIIVE